MRSLRTLRQPKPSCRSHCLLKTKFIGGRKRSSCGRKRSSCGRKRSSCRKKNSSFSGNNNLQVFFSGFYVVYWLFSCFIFWFNSACFCQGEKQRKNVKPKELIA
eukprot:Lithocolla_globosa_v1_NODE_58_length_7390_cov_243.140014.p11 type:complete len:104 gc:universal NODE_58_length_7390_cov_243.140014:2675-2986(+)